MARCPIKSCRWKGKKDGVPIHLARMHGVHREEEASVADAPERLMESIVQRWDEANQ